MGFFGSQTLAKRDVLDLWKGQEFRLLILFASVQFFWVCQRHMFHQFLGKGSPFFSSLSQAYKMYTGGGGPRQCISFYQNLKMTN